MAETTYMFISMFIHISMNFKVQIEMQRPLLHKEYHTLYFNSSPTGIYTISSGYGKWTQKPYSLWTLGSATHPMNFNEALYIPVDSNTTRWKVFNFSL